MNIEFKRIEIDGFMSYGHVELELANCGYTRVIGINNNVADNARSNGSGKSAWSDAIVWALTGDTIRGVKNVSNIYLNQGCYVKLEFNVDKDSYIILRSRDHKEYKSNLKVWINGEDKSGKGLRDTEKLLADYLPDLTTSFIGSVIILGQGLPQRFTQNTPSGRKDILEKLSKSDFMIEDLKDRISQRSFTLNQQIRELDDNHVRLVTTQESLKSQIEEVKVNISNQPSIKSLENEYLAYESELREADLNLDTSNKKITDIKNQITALSQEVLRLQTQKHEDEKAIFEQLNLTLSEHYAKRAQLQAAVSTKIAEINKLEAIQDICPTCGQKLQGVEKPDTTYLREELRSIQDAELKNQESIKLIESQKSDRLNCLKDKYKNIEDHNSQTLFNLTDTYTALCNEQKAIQTFRDSITQKLYAIAAKKESLELTTQTLINKLTQLDKSLMTTNSDLLYNEEESLKLLEHKKIIDKFTTIVTRDFRGFLLSNIIEYINKRAKEYCLDIFDTDKIAFELNNNNIDICYDGRMIEALSGGEQQKVNLIVQLALRDMLCTFMNFSCNLFVMDEILDNVDAYGSQKILSLISKKLLDIDSIFIITHHDNELNIPYDNELCIVKNSEGVSTLR